MNQPDALETIAESMQKDSERLKSIKPVSDDVLKALNEIRKIESEIISEIEASQK